MHMYTLHLLSAIYFWNVKFLGHFHSLSSAVAHLHMEGTQRNANIHPEHKNTTTQKLNPCTTSALEKQHALYYSSCGHTEPQSSHKQMHNTVCLTTKPMATVISKGATLVTLLFPITSSIAEQFSHFFQRQTQQQICNKVVIEDPTTP